MHLQQTKRGSIETGGPQYYFHNLSEVIKTYLRKKGAVPVALVTPYGATKSNFFAVSKDHKRDNKGQIVEGRVGHDRIQQGLSEGSIGEMIRHWYLLPSGNFERIDVDIEVLEDTFYVTPLSYKFANQKRTKQLVRVERSLTFTMDYVSPFWVEQIKLRRKQNPELLNWSLKEICRVVRVHGRENKLAHIQEPDILRASGPLAHLGMLLGGYVGKGYDCFTEFQFGELPPYSVPVELKRSSKGFEYQQKKYGKDELSRAVVLCAIHNHTQVPKNIDVIELEALCNHALKIG